MKIEEHDLFGNGVPFNRSFLIKAQLKVPVRPARLPAAQDIIDRSVAVVDARYARLNHDIAAVLKHADARKSLGLFIIDGGLVDSDLFKAGGQPPKGQQPQGPKQPTTNLSGQQRAKRGAGPNPNYQRKEMDTGRAGSRGGKWYLNAQGKVVYGTKTSPEHKELSEEEVQTHLQHFRPTPFMGVKGGDQLLVDYLMDTKNQKLHGFTQDDADFLSAWYGTKDGSTGAWEGGIAQDFMENFGVDLSSDTDLSTLKLNQEELTGGKWVSYQEAVHNFLKASYEDNGFDWEDVEPHINSLYQRYEQMKSNPKLRDALAKIGEDIERSQYAFFLKAADHEDDMKSFGDVVTASTDPNKQAQTVGAALAAMDLLFEPTKGETNKKAGLKGVVCPNVQYLAPDSPSHPNPLLADRDRFAAMSTPQLMAVAIAANLYACWDADEKEYVLPSAGFKMNDVGQTALLNLHGRLKLNDSTTKIIKDQITEASRNLADKLNAANKGEDQVFKEFIRQGSDVLKDKEHAEAIQKRHEEWIKLRDDALEAQKDDNFEMPETMADGALGGELQKNPLPHQQITDADGNVIGVKKLFQHQKQAINWMDKVKRGIIALDAGMGKTPTVITFMENLKAKNPGQHKPAILFLPPSLMNQWPDEISAYAPSAKDKILNLSGLSLEERKVALQSDLAKKAEYILISTGTLNSGGSSQEGETPEENDGTGGTDNELTEMLKNLDGALFIDEVHQGGYKTGDSIRHKIASEVIGDREHAFGMTATPMPNGPMDLFHLTNMFAPGAVGTKDEWEGGLHGTQYNSLTDQWEVTNPQNLVELRTRTRPFVFHKLITDPDVQKDMKGSLQKLTSAPQSVNISENHPMWNYVMPGGIIDHMVEARIQELEKDRETPYSDRTRQKLSNLLAVNFHRLANISPSLIDDKYQDGPGRSPKVDRMVDDIVAHFKGGGGTEDKPLVIFSSYPQKAFPLLRKRLAAAGIDPSLVGEIHGGKSARERAFEQDMTNTGKRKVLLVGTMSGGAGLNLQKKASKMMFLDEPWHPAAKRQAQGRVWRTGQKNPVMEMNYRVSLPQGVSWDERVAEKIGGKQAMVTAMLTDVDVTNFDFGASADAAIDQLLGSSKDIKNITKKRKSGVKTDALTAAQKLKDYYAEEFQNYTEDPDSDRDIPDVNETFKKDGDYSQFHNKDQQKRLGKEAPHVSGAIDEDIEWKGWNLKFKQKNARQNFKVKETLVEAYKNGDQKGNADKLKDAEKKVRGSIEQYRTWYVQAVHEAASMKAANDPGFKDAKKQVNQMKKDFPEAFAKQPWDPKSWKNDDLDNAKQPKTAMPPSEKNKKPGAQKKPQKQEPEHIVSESNPFKQKGDPIAHQGWTLLSKKKPKDQAEAVKHLEPMLKKIGSEDPTKDAKALYAYLKKNKGVR